MSNHQCGLGSPRAALHTPGDLRAELTALRGLPAGPINVHFTYHRTFTRDAEQTACRCC